MQLVTLQVKMAFYDDIGPVNIQELTRAMRIALRPNFEDTQALDVTGNSFVVAIPDPNFEEEGEVCAWADKAMKEFKKPCN